MRWKRWIRLLMGRPFRDYFYYARKFGTLNVIRQEHLRQRAKRKKARLAFIESVRACQNPSCRSTKNLTIDHIIPISKGGSRGKKENWQVLCKRCNQKKADKVS